MKTNQSLRRNIALLFLVKASGFVLPLLTLPFLARVLGPEELGVVVVAQSMALLFGVVVEYGFSLSATRDIARHRGDPVQVAELVCRVHSAKVMLSVVALALALLAARFVPGMGNMTFALGAWAYATVIGFSPAWFFQGMESLRLMSVMDIAGKAASVALIYMCVGSDGAEHVLFLQSLGPAVAVALSMVWMYRSVDFRAPRVTQALWGLKEGGSMFIFRAAISLYTLANVFVLGLFVGPVQVAYFAGAEKLVRGAASAIGPVSQAIYPRVARLVVEDRQASIRLVQRTLLWMGTVTFAGAVFACLVSPQVTRLFFGPGYEPVAGMLRGLVWIVPLIAVGNVLGIQWMLALKMDREFNVAVICAGVVNLIAAACLARSWGATGMVAASVLSEAVVVALILHALIKRRALPLLQTDGRIRGEP